MILSMLRTRSVVLLGLVVTSLAVGVLCGAYVFQQYHLSDGFARQMQWVDESFRDLLEHDRQELAAVSAALQRNDAISAAWQSGDRARLLAVTRPIFDELKRRSRITHLYFHGADGVNYLRVHKPEKFGDRIGRLTLAGAARGGKAFAGWELGPMGTLTLRHVEPWGVGGRRIGYVELGEEIDHVIDQVRRLAHSEILVTLDKRHLNRDGWEQGMKLMGRTPRWGQLADRVVACQSASPIDAAVLDHLAGADTLPWGTPRHYHLAGRQYMIGVLPLRDVGGVRVGDLAVCYDITWKHAAMERLQRILAACCASILLLVGVALAASRGAERQLQEIRQRAEDERRDREAAEAATRAKSEFLANMSHEIRTPMTAILGHAEILAESLECPNHAETARIIKRNGDHLLTILNDVLDLSKIEAGQMHVEPVPCSPAEIVADVASLMRPRASAKGLALVVGFNGPLPRTILTDPLRLRQILMNLVGNAVKFTDSGQVRIVTRMAGRDTPEPKLECVVIDTGIGMTAEQVGRLFRPFSQADAATNRVYGGTGLGLAISKHLAMMLGGDITVSTAAGEGSTFQVSVSAGRREDLTMLPPPAEAVGHAHASTPPLEASELPLDCRVLLVEDGPDNQRLIAFLLRKAGAEVTLACNGKEAVEKALAPDSQPGCEQQPAGEPFDVILMDIQMPIMDGYEATGRLRAAGYAGPIIALTAHAMKEDVQRCLNAGCNQYLTKPIDRAVLLTAVAEHARRQRERVRSGN